MLYTTLVHALPLLVERVAENAAPRLSNLLISNPFGFAGEAYLMGAKVELALPISVVAAGHKLNVTAVTPRAASADRFSGDARGGAAHRPAGAPDRAGLR
jgi:hypothetical protein